MVCTWMKILCLFDCSTKLAHWVWPNGHAVTIYYLEQWEGGALPLVVMDILLHKAEEQFQLIL